MPVSIPSQLTVNFGVHVCFTCLKTPTCFTEPIKAANNSDIDVFEFLFFILLKISIFFKLPSILKLSPSIWSSLLQVHSARCRIRAPTATRLRSIWKVMMKFGLRWIGKRLGFTSVGFNAQWRHLGQGPTLRGGFGAVLEWRRTSACSLSGKIHLSATDTKLLFCTWWIIL